MAPQDVAPADAVPRDGELSPFYIPASVATATQALHVLKHAGSFMVVDQLGDMQAAGAAPEGLFFCDTRHLARLVLTLNGVRPLLLSSTAAEDNTMVLVDLANPDLARDGRIWLARNTVHMLRTIVLGPDALFQLVELQNYGATELRCRLALEFDADFADLFEVRGAVRPQRGETLADEPGEAGPVLAYRGLDGVVRRTHIACEPPPQWSGARTAYWDIELPSGYCRAVELAVRCERDGRSPSPSSFEASLAAASSRTDDRKKRAADLSTSNATFNDWLGRSRSDLDMLIGMTPYGLYADAGIPWFSTPFGRDGLITALECLWLDPALAAGTLRFLAATQATSLDPATDAEPGKILHETRNSEMARLGEVPFARYYGSIDATPLFVMLAAAYYARTGDLDLIGTIWPNIEAALAWMTTYGDSDGDGFLEYHRQSVNGLVNQGWKDSGDSVFHADGRLAEPPIALVEVQAYAFAAYQGGASLAAALGKLSQAAELTVVAERLRAHFEQAFWCDELGTYALALDGSKKPCRIRASNAGHALLAGLARPDRAQRVADTLMTPAFFSQWGVRTVAEGEARYNPISYHNGSVWPHDNGLIALGFARYGLTQPLLSLLTGLFDAATFMSLRRLPELFCGFERRPASGPTAYPVACSPQAWSSASVLAMLGATLGISFDVHGRQISFTRPTLPSWLDGLTITNLSLGEANVDLQLQRSQEGVVLRVLRRDGMLDVVVTV